MEYLSQWRKRCYSDDIPDSVLPRVEQSGRAPSYRAIAIALLKNDLHLHSLGFARAESELSLGLVRERQRAMSKQEGFRW